ncbi:glucosamine-6-phosphate deaminase [Aliiruegeria haliotis]|uniref:Glucosamine-6-phosphate deaminase n=1 Tax=Aliiruegeria haliotis TaxID=1280846 RepID=A0A2T0RLV3_9RHOB|nr:glucosamine-6-phosphate deaminase [Aliiruegeria haliotis]PRY22176.1 glucosamine-6-phosphate deaminase [Aliiruegeria haliotis]
MKVLIHNSAELAQQAVADILSNRIAASPASVLGLATGGTMEAVYDRLILALSESGVPVEEVKTFNLDEYWGLAPDHPATYRSYMNSRLFGRAGFPVGRTFLPASDAADPVAESAAYEAKIRDAGGIDLQLLGIGQNGHIGFNEPTSSLASRTRLKTLTESTRMANQQYFDGQEATPKYAITMGIGTILDARDCLLLATGSNKADAVRKMIEGPLGAHCPASALQLHPKATVVLDAAAATDLTLREYYQYVHPDGIDVQPSHG